jgi:Holliday junction resolvase RusA-like endonuclease
MTVSFTLHGKMKSGKNHVQITRTGRRYPNKSFSIWREEMLRQIDYKGKPLQGRVWLEVSYFPGDRLRRDAPGILDALLHLFEKSGILTDDAQIKEVSWQENAVQKYAPQCRILLDTLDD